MQDHQRVSYVDLDNSDDLVSQLKTAFPTDSQASKFVWIKKVQRPYLVVGIRLLLVALSLPAALGVYWALDKFAAAATQRYSPFGEWMDGLAADGYAAYALVPIVFALVGVLLVTQLSRVVLNPLYTRLQGIADVCSAETADSLLSRDTRRPIIFLRSFADEDRFTGYDGTVDRMMRLEDYLVDDLAHVGPFIGIGNPSDFVPKRGATRLYVPRDELKRDAWKDIVTKWINQARVVIILVGSTAGLDWEVRRIVELGLKKKAIWLLLNDDRDARLARLATYWPSIAELRKPGLDYKNVMVFVGGDLGPIAYFGDNQHSKRFALAVLRAMIDLERPARSM